MTTAAGHVPVMNCRKQGQTTGFNQIGFHMFSFEINTNIRVLLKFPKNEQYDIFKVSIFYKVHEHDYRSVIVIIFNYTRFQY